MGCGEFLVKYILFFTNLFFALAGLALLGVGVAIQLKITEVTELLDGALMGVPITSMVVGGVVFLIAFFGCCGAIRESNCMLVTFSIFMLVLMALKLTMAVLIFVKMDTVLEQSDTWVNNQFQQNQTHFSEIETMLKCCGSTGASSYGTRGIPDSCCARAPCSQSDSYQGCSEVLRGYIETFGLAIGIVAITAVAIELVAAVFGLCLANHVRNKYRRARY